ncbi:MAG: hypothetical protein HY551_03335 [Elusimicrobia bacterium]|nr:hypothetical protein [Elusimicrobiota bacterium]
MKKRSKSSSTVRRIKAIRKKPFPDNDPEWEQLETRYGQMDSGDMHRLAEILAIQSEETEEPFR